MASAISLVFGTPELLESILIQLSLPSLLQAQLISRSINALIRTSPTLQQLLFFRLSQPTPSWRLNPFLRHHFSPFFFIPEDISTGTDKSTFQFMKWTHHASSRPPFMRKEASWRNMFAVQPPPATLLVSRGTYHVDPATRSYRVYDGADEEEGEEVAKVTFDYGVTMGTIYDIVLSFLSRDPAGVFSLAFESRADGVGMALRLYSVVLCDTDEHDEDVGELYESEGREAGSDDLEWIQVRQDRLDEDHKLSEMYTAWGLDLTQEKGGVREEDWWGKAHHDRIQEFMAR